MRNKETICALTLFTQQTNGDQELANVVERPGEEGERVRQGHIEAIDCDQAVGDDVHPAADGHQGGLVLRKG